MSSSEITFSIQESLEGGYQARALSYSIFTEADSLDELKTMIRDAISCHFDAANKPASVPYNLILNFKRPLPPSPG